MGFNIFAGFDVPTTILGIEVLPEVFKGNKLNFDLLPVSYSSGKKFDLLQVTREENILGGVTTSRPP